MDALPPGRRKRAHDVADHVAELIGSGALRPGEELPSERALMERCGVGRPSVREALFLLQQRGVLDVHHGRRARVLDGAPHDLLAEVRAAMQRFTAGGAHQKEVEQVRAVFEAGVAWHAAQVASDGDVAGLYAAWEENRAALHVPERFVRTDIAFHRAIGSIVRNPMFDMMYTVLGPWLTEQRTETILMPDADRLSVDGHGAIYAAIKARDPARAYHEMATHLRIVAEIRAEARRVSADILRSVTQDVAARVGREQQALWDASVKLRRRRA